MSIKPPQAEVYGAIPDSLAGTWLVIESPRVKAPNASSKDQVGNAIKAFRISHTIGHWRVEELQIEPPTALADALLAATREQIELVPSPEVLSASAALANAQPRKELPDRIVLFTPDQSPLPKHKTPPADVKFTLGMFAKGDTKSPSGGLQYQAIQIAPNSITGRWSSATLATGAQFGALPIGIAGTFAMYRLR